MLAKDRVVLKATLSNPPNFPRRERFETSFIWVRWGAMVGLEARGKHAHASLVSRLLSGEILKEGVDQPLSHFIIPFY